MPDGVIISCGGLGGSQFSDFNKGLRAAGYIVVEPWEMRFNWGLEDTVGLILAFVDAAMKLEKPIILASHSYAFIACAEACVRRSGLIHGLLSVDAAKHLAGDAQWPWPENQKGNSLRPTQPTLGITPLILVGGPPDEEITGDHNSICHNPLLWEKWVPMLFAS